MISMVPGLQRSLRANQLKPICVEPKHAVKVSIASSLVYFG